MEDRKINFFKRVKLAIFNFERYQDFALENTKTAVKYLLKLVLAFILIVCLAITYQLSLTFKNVFQAINDEMPDFTFANNILTSKTEEPMIIEKEDNRLNYIFILDTNADQSIENYNDQIKNYNFGIVFFKDKLIISTNGIMQTFSYETLANQYNISELNKQQLIDNINNINPTSASIALYITLVLYLYCSYLISTLLETLLLFILGFLIARIVGLKLKNGQIYSIAIYSLTLPILLNTIYMPVNMLTGFEVKYFPIMYRTISYIYLITSILMIRSNLIKQKVEIGKIEDVQKEIRKEIEEREEKEREDTEEKKKKEEEKKEKEDNNSGGEAPEGSV